MYDDLVRLCRERAAEYGALRKSSMTAIALDRSAAAIERLQAELAEAVAKEREACARVMDERAAMYRVKAEPHAGSCGEAYYSVYETRIGCAEAVERCAAAIRERT